MEPGLRFARRSWRGVVGSIPTAPTKPMLFSTTYAPVSNNKQLSNVSQMLLYHGARGGFGPELDPLPRASTKLAVRGN